MYIYTVAFITVVIFMGVHALSVNRASLSTTARGAMVRLSAAGAICVSVSAIFLLAFAETGQMPALASANSAAAGAPIFLWLALHHAGGGASTITWRYILAIPISQFVIAIVVSTMTSALPRETASIALNAFLSLQCAFIAAKAYSAPVRRLRGSRLVGNVMVFVAAFMLFRAIYIATPFTLDNNIALVAPLWVVGITMVVLCSIGIATMSGELGRAESAKIAFIKQRAPIAMSRRTGEIFSAYRITIEDLPLVYIAYGEDLCNQLQGDLAKLVIRTAPPDAEIHEVGNDGFILVTRSTKVNLVDEIRRACESDIRQKEGLSVYSIDINQLSGEDPAALVTALRRSYPARTLSRALQFTAVKA